MISLTKSQNLITEEDKYIRKFTDLVYVTRVELESIRGQVLAFSILVVVHLMMQTSLRKVLPLHQVVNQLFYCTSEKRDPGDE